MKHAFEDLDRISPSRRDACPRWATGRQTWKDLLFLHWEVPVSVIRPLVPESLHIDTFEGRAFVGLVPFTMHRVRFGPVPVPTFLEVNVRTYVHAQGVPGVYFLSLDAENPLVVHAARALYRLPYEHARMKAAVRGARTEYRSERMPSNDAMKPKGMLDVAWTVDDEPAHHATPGTLEHFLTERYSFYGTRGANGMYRVRVHHAPWPLRPARIERLETSLLAVAGLRECVPLDLTLASPAGVDVLTFATNAIVP